MEGFSEDCNILSWQKQRGKDQENSPVDTAIDQQRDLEHSI